MIQTQYALFSDATISGLDRFPLIPSLRLAITRLTCCNILHIKRYEARRGVSKYMCNQKIHCPSDVACYQVGLWRRWLWSLLLWGNMAIGQEGNILMDMEEQSNENLT